MADSIEKVSIIVSKSGIDGIYPGLIMANGARAEGIEVNLFFTFFGLDAIHKKRQRKIRIATVGNVGLPLPTWVGGIPGMSAAMSKYFMRTMDKLDIPSVPEFIEFISDTGAGIYACQLAADMFGYTQDDFVGQVKDIITVGEFYEIAAGGEIIFT